MGSDVRVRVRDQVSGLGYWSHVYVRVRVRVRIRIRVRVRGVRVVTYVQSHTGHSIMLTRAPASNERSLCVCVC